MYGLPERVVGAIGSSAISWSDRHWRMVAEAYARNPNAGFGQGVQGFLTELGLVGSDPRRHITSGYDPMYGFQMLHSTGATYDAFAPPEVFHVATSEGRPTQPPTPDPVAAVAAGQVPQVRAAEPDPVHDALDAREPFQAGVVDGGQLIVWLVVALAIGLLFRRLA